jgi:hypothetical protein
MRCLAMLALLVLSACGEPPLDDLDDLGAEARAAPAACDPTQFQMGSNPTQCCQDGKKVFYVAAPPMETRQALWFRRLETPCTMADGSTQCGQGTGIMCDVGPCRGFTFKGVLADSVRVFEPESKPGTCGWEVKGHLECTRGCDWSPKKSVRFHPEPFDGQTLYPGVTGTCPYRACRLGTPCRTPDCSDL